MSIKRTNAGFHTTLLLLAIVIISLVGFAGYRVYVTNQDKNVNSVKNSVESELTIDSDEDLDKAADQLNNLQSDDEALSDELKSL